MHTAVADGLAPEDVLATAEMLARPRKTADLAAEVAAFRELSALMAVDPARVVQRFLELALVLCGAGSSGLSVLAEDGRGEPVFRWDALAGAFAPYVGGTTPRRFSPSRRAWLPGTVHSSGVASPRSSAASRPSMRRISRSW